MVVFAESNRNRRSRFRQADTFLFWSRLLEMSARAWELSATINDLFPKVLALESAVSKAVEKWKT